MEPKTYQRLQSIVTRASELASEARAGFLSDECAGDDGLLAEAQRLLAMMLEGAGVYSEQVVGAHRSQLDSIFDSATNEAQSNAWIPERIGQFTLRRMIGRGGTGVVFEAEQQSPRRSVALKLLHPSLATPMTIARIAKEADVLARLQHPGIAQIFEAGSFDAGAGAQPFFAMELVEGYDLARHAHHAELNRRGRVELLAQVCDAVQHAHERGVIHRDLKPDNVLVTVDGQPKLLDFGIARMARDSAMSIEALTAEGQLLGTAVYMAPEQALGQVGAHDADAMGPVIDVFALGAIGFELLAQRRPRELEGLSMTQVMQTVATTDIASLRSIDPAIEPDLDTIFGKACASEPRRRYESAAALGADLRRWLHHRPIAARPPTAVYRATRFVRRHRVLALGVGATVTSLALGLAVSIYLAAVARDAAAETQRKLYAAEMLVATGASMDPATRIRSARLTEHWRGSLNVLGWEWYLMDAVRRRDVLKLDLPGFPVGLDWHFEGERIAVAMETSVSILDATNGTCLATRSFEESLPDNHHLTGVRWRPNGTSIAVSAESRVFMWEPEPGEEREVIRWEHRSEFAPDLCWHPDGKRIFYVGHSVVGLDASTGKVVFKGDASPWGISGNLFDSDGDRIAFARSLDHSLTYSFPSLKPDLVLPDLRLPVLSRVAWSPNDRWLAASGTDHTVRVVDTVTEKVLFTNREHDETVFGLDWHPDGRHLVVSAEDGSVRVLDIQTGRAVETYLRHETRVPDVRWSPDAKRLATVAISGEALIWNTERRSAFRIFADPRLGGDTPDRRLQWESSTGRLLACKTNIATAFWPEGDKNPEAIKHSGRVSLSLDRDWRATSNGASSFRIERRSTGELTHQMSIGNDSLLMHDWAPGQDVVLAASSLGLWRFSVDDSGDVDSARLAEVSGQVNQLRCSPEGARCAFIHLQTHITIADAETGATLAMVEPEARVTQRALCWSPGGERLALAGSDGRLRLLNARTGQLEATLLGHTNQIEGVDWHPSRPRIATGGRDRSVKLWNAETGDLTASFPCQAVIADVHWIQDGRALSAIDVEGNVYTWDASRSLPRIPDRPQEVRGSL